MLAAIPRSGIPARLLYGRLDVPPQALDLVLQQLIARGRIVRVLGEYRRTGPVAQRCRDCGELLPLSRFGRHGGGTPFAVCKHCRGHNISRGNFAYHARKSEDLCNSN